MDKRKFDKKVSKKHVKKLLSFLISINNPNLKYCQLPYASEACFLLIDHKTLIYKKNRQNVIFYK